MNPRLGLIYALIAAASYALMSFLVHWNPHHFPVGQMTFLRALLTVLGMLPFCWRDLPAFIRPGAPALWARGILGSAGLFLYYFTLQGTVSGNANFLFWGATPLFVSALSALCFREWLTKREAGGIALVMLANVLLYIPTRATMPLWVWETGLAGGFVSSIAYLLLGTITKRYSGPLIVFSFAAASVLLSLAWPERPWQVPQGGDWLFLLGMAVLGLCSQLFTTLSFAHLKSGVATSLGRTSVLFAGGLDVVCGGYHPHWLEWASYLVVIAGVVLTQKQEPAAKRVSPVLTPTP